VGVRPAAAAFRRAPQPGDIRPPEIEKGSIMPKRNAHPSVTGWLAGSAAALALAAPAAVAQEAGSAYEVETIAEGLEHPWGMAFLPGAEEMLVTERAGRLRRVDLGSGEMEEIGGLPEIAAVGQGGLLDVALSPDFEEIRWVYLTYVARNEEGLTSTYFGRGQLEQGATELTGWEELYVIEPHMDDGQGHYGSRIAFDDEGHVFVSTGDRQMKDFGPDHIAQDLSSANGSMLRFALDGSIPEDNPFVGEADAVDAIWSYGLRNVQGMAFHPDTGELWVADHGENNGDEINIVERGANHGWPIATYGHHYRTGEPFAPTPPEVPETVDPVYWWDFDHPEGFPPSGFLFYTGDAFPDWQGDFFVGNLAHRYLGRFSVDGRDVEMEERLLEGEGWRIRAVAQGPEDGYLYVLVDDSDAPIVRLRPGEGS
jgi:aldose sugar dehydrogenase